MSSLTSTLTPWLDGDTARRTSRLGFEDGMVCISMVSLMRSLISTHGSAFHASSMQERALQSVAVPELYFLGVASTLLATFTRTS